MNNAAVGDLAPIGLLTEALYDRIFNANTKGVFFACQQAVKVLRNKGRIINIGTGKFFSVTPLFFF